MPSTPQQAPGKGAGVGAGIPSHFANPWGLLGRILRTRDGDAYYALWTALASLGLSPLDRLLEGRELELYRSAPSGSRPPLFVCGPPRSGTTLAFQTLVRAFDVSYPTNLVAMFPRAPIAATRRLSRPFRNASIEPRSYYGRTHHWYGTSDALHLWDRWLDPDRRKITRRIGGEAADAMRAFFRAWDAAFDRPLVMKNNSLNTSAALVAAELPGSVFVMLQREPFFLAQALLRARSAIHGDPQAVYGVDDPDRPRSGDPLEDVALQVAFHQHQAQIQQAATPDDRLLILDYEHLCADPLEWVRAIGERMGWGGPLREPAPQRPSLAVRLETAKTERLRAALKAAGVAL